MPAMDFHSHSLYSDGSLTPAELVAAAANAGVTTLALTDHDSLRGLPEAQQAAAEHGLQLINGVEVSVLWRQTVVHVVGLNIDPQFAPLLAGMSEQGQARGRRALLIAARLQELGLGDCWQQVLAMAEGDANRVGRTHFARYLHETGRVRNLQQAFDRYLGNGKRAAVPVPWTDLATACQWLRGAGGVPVLAHPARYGISQTRLRELLAEFVEAGGQAMEVSTANERPNVVSHLAGLSKRFGLHASQGSDFHGSSMPWIKLGQFAPLPEGCVPVWDLFGEPAALGVH